MASTLIENISGFTGLSGDSPVDFESNTVTVTAIDGLTAVKSADPVYWVNGELTFTVVVSNAADNETFSDGVFTDQLDAAITLATSADPVQIDGVPAAYTFADNLLTINDLPDVEPGESITLTFRVVRA